VPSVELTIEHNVVAADTIPAAASNSYTLPPALSHLVDMIWFYENYDPPHNSERMLPSGTVEMVFDLSGNEAVVSGAHSVPAVLDTSQPFSVIGVHFKPGGAFPFFKPPVDELRNIVVPLQALWGNSACDVTELLIEAKTLPQRFNIIESALLNHAARYFNRHPAVDFALNQFEHIMSEPRIGEITEQIGLSSRRFIELFRSQVGLTPKLYCRVRRFQRMLDLIHTTDDVEWTQFALDCGYYDQAHFIHDFQTFSDLSPSEYLRIRGEHLNHVPLP